MVIIVVDHRDSFTFNIVHLLKDLSRTAEVRDYREVDASICLVTEGVILGPGPHCPEDVPESIGLMRCLAGRVPVLGICLGHQIIGAAYGAAIRRASRVVHGVYSTICHSRKGLFSELDDPLRFVRYHSQVVVEPLPPELRVDARDEEGDIAALTHREKPIWGVQFHPESILSHNGKAILGRFIVEADAFRRKSGAPIEREGVPVQATERKRQ